MIDLGSILKVAVENGAAQVVGLSSPFSLMDATDAQYGERAASDAAADAALGLARVFAEPSRLHRRAGREATIGAEVRA